MLVDRTRIVIGTTVIIMVMMHDAKHQRHAQVHQTYENAYEPRFHHAEGNLNPLRKKVK
jgi:hypothetical protein